MASYILIVIQEHGTAARGAVEVAHPNQDTCMPAITASPTLSLACFFTQHLQKYMLGWMAEASGANLACEAQGAQLTCMQYGE